MTNETDRVVRVADVMTSPVYTLTSTHSLPLAESLMGLAKVRHVPIVDDGRLVGILTHRDLLAASLSVLGPLTADERSSVQLAVPVSRIMRRDPWTITSTAPAVSAARLMRDHAFGCLPVVDDGVLVGIVTESDLLSLLTGTLDLAAVPTPWTVEQVMTVSPATITGTTTIAEARRAMVDLRVRHLPILDEGVPIGVVSDRDLRVAETVYPDPKDASAACAIDLVGKDRPHAVAPTASLADVLLEMHAHRVDAVLVVDRGRLVGILSALDACRLLGDHIRRSSALPHKA